MRENDNRLGHAERDVVALGIAIAAIIMFVGTGGAVMPKVLDSLLGTGAAPDPLLTNAMLLNIALIIFGWRRYRDLTAEISERRRAEESARRLAEMDPLTGCLNRRAMEHTTTELHKSCKAAGKAVAFVMVDLDNFKQVNDMNGHGIGDKVLSEFAGRLRRCLPPETPVARLGGDEFAFALAYDPKNPDSVDEIVSRVFQASGGRIELGHATIDSTMSVGIAADHDANGHPVDGLDGEILMHRADIAMYRAKKDGKNRYSWFEATMESELRFRNQLESGIRRGIANGEFVPYYEQQVDLDTGELVGFEMLARWHSADLGVVKPEVFIPIAEEIGVIAELSEMLLRQAFADAKEWDPDLTLSANISPVQLRDQWFAQRLLKLLVECNFPAHRLEIEVTETCLHENMGQVRSMLASLRNQGVKVSLDDFGTGYASLSQLRTLPFDRIKIDRSFVRELRDSDNSKIVDAIVSLGNGLQMPITAEGIEDEETLSTLRRMGQLKGQGYLYGRPETALQVRERLQSAGRLQALRPDLPGEEIKPAEDDNRRRA